MRLRRLALRLHVALWARWLPVLAREPELHRLLKRAAPPPGTPYAGIPADIIIRRVRKACRRPVLMRDRPCLREGLLAYRFLRLAGFRPRLHFGVDRDSAAAPRLAAHCWVSLDGRVVLNPPLPSHVEVLAVGPE